MQDGCDFVKVRVVQSYQSFQKLIFFRKWKYFKRQIQIQMQIQIQITSIIWFYFESETIVKGSRLSDPVNKMTLLYQENIEEKTKKTKNTDFKNFLSFENFAFIHWIRKCDFILGSDLVWNILSDEFNHCSHLYILPVLPIFILYTYLYYVLSEFEFFFVNNIVLWEWGDTAFLSLSIHK